MSPFYAASPEKVNKLHLQPVQATREPALRKDLLGRPRMLQSFQHFRSLTLSHLDHYLKARLTDKLVTSPPSNAIPATAFLLLAAHNVLTDKGKSGSRTHEAVYVS